MYPKSKPPKAKPRFHGPFIIVKKLDKGAVIVRLQDGSEEIVNLDRHTFKGQPMIEWTKDFVHSEKKDMGKSTALVPATRTQVIDEENQVSPLPGGSKDSGEVIKYPYSCFWFHKTNVFHLQQEINNCIEDI